MYYCRRSDIDISSCNEVEVFFKKYFLYWLESLVLFGCIFNRVDMVCILDSMFSVSGLSFGGITIVADL